jgi:hypothetical protein
LDISGQCISIIDWNVINLIASEQPLNVACNARVESKKSKSVNGICGKKAKYTKGELCVCETHAKTQNQYLVPKKETSSAYIKKLKLEPLRTLYNQTHPFNAADTGPKIKQAYMDALNTYYSTHCFELVNGKTVSANDVDLISIGRAIQHHLDILTCFDNVTHVVIENQISTIATRMKTIQGMLAQYFIAKYKQQPVRIEFVSSANKLKGLVKLTDSPLQPSSVSVVNSGVNPNYKAHKNDSVRITGDFVCANDSLANWRGLFGLDDGSGIKPKSHHKKDDLADCFLQGVWYLKHQNIINYAENLNINIV